MHIKKKNIKTFSEIIALAKTLEQKKINDKQTKAQKLPPKNNI